ncbi:hypothetical protein I79_006069 [Cricetulus griseus]|uniref:Uncharacterized protein n=1 Tax=Cricetulus griseus TaxID=10029 RepID=G3H6U9_CRIGR|nr:hypothetical protein I79_006069 [Cricetulus griseus]
MPTPQMQSENDIDVSPVKCEGWKGSLKGYAMTKYLCNASRFFLCGLRKSSGWHDDSRCQK